MKKNSTSKGKNIKSAKKDKASTNKKKEIENKNKQKEKDYQRLEEYLNESGLSLAFNIIFAELISKQILPENFFTYTSMRLTQIGKEIEGLKTKEAIYVDEPEEQKVENVDEQGQEQVEQPPQEENKEEKIFMTSPQQNKNQNQKVQAQETKSQKSNLKKKK